MGPDYYTYGPWPGGAALDFLRPIATEATALLWIVVMIVLAASLLSFARLHAPRTES